MAVENLRPLPEELDVFVGWPGEDLGLIGAATHGELSTRLRSKLTHDGVKVNDLPLSAQFSAWSAALELRSRVPSTELSALGLTQYFRPGAQLSGLVVCVGDDPWDFAFACARDRMAGDARWLPSTAADDIDAVASVARLAARVRTRSTGPLRLCSVSDRENAVRFAASLAALALARDIPTQIAEPLELVPDSPGRLYERERVGFYQSLVVHRGRTPPLPTPVPQNVSGNSAFDIRWMTDVHVQDWIAVRHASLTPGVLSNTVTKGMSRCGRDGLAYFCPGPLVHAGRSLETQTMRPKLAPPR